MSGHNLNYQLSENYGLIVPDPGDTGTLELDRSDHIYEIVSGASGETRSISSPEKTGIRLVIIFKTDGGGNVDITGANSETFWDGSAARTNIQLNDARDFIELISSPDGTDIEWTVVSNAGCTLS